MSRWRKAWGESAIGGEKLLLRDMVLNEQYRIWVSKADFEVRHPQEFPIDTTEVYPPNPASQLSIPQGEGTPAPAPVFDANGVVDFV